MIDILDIKEGESYACKFKVEVMLDMNDKPHPNLSDTPLKGPGVYEGLGIINVRDTKSQLVELQDEKSKKTFVVPFSDIWDIDTVDWVDDTE
jgi:hypothetical protein|tara:strand:+ start:418 stop:693 length:276 start_codon:yes stop_codon:yes gene_type:complete